jgi:hypothetical protein
MEVCRHKSRASHKTALKLSRRPPIEQSYTHSIISLPPRQNPSPVRLAKSNSGRRRLCLVQSVACWLALKHLGNVEASGWLQPHNSCGGARFSRACPRSRASPSIPSCRFGVAPQLIIRPLLAPKKPRRHMTAGAGGGLQLHTRDDFHRPHYLNLDNQLLFISPN